MNSLPDPNTSTYRRRYHGAALRTTGHRRGGPDSQQVSWWSVHEYVQPLLDATGSWPMAGTAAWCALPDDDPLKLAALLDAAQHWALRVETCQQASCEASRNVSAAEDWPAIASEISQRREVYILREVR